MGADPNDTFLFFGTPDARFHGDEMQDSGLLLRQIKKNVYRCIWEHQALQC